MVGAGQAAAQLAISLRGAGHAGPITLVGEEPHLPYQRPPLSKKFLQGELPTERLLLRQADYYERNDIRVLTGRRAVRIDRGKRLVELADGAALPYTRLVLATGGRSRMLPEVPADMAGIHTLRSIADAQGLRLDVNPGSRVLLIGGGYIGLEVAATLRTLGCEVTVVEAEPQILGRVAAPPVAQQLHACHVGQGGRILCGAQVAAVRGGARVERVVMADGTEHAVDALVVGVGMLPNDALARQADIDCWNGVLVNASGRTSDPAIYAIGDVASQLIAGSRLRIESVDNAIQTAKRAAADIAGTAPPAEAPPWFWSDQFDQKLQMVGLAPAGADWVIRAEPERRRLSCFAVDGGRLSAAQCLNAGGDFMVAKRLVAAGRRVDTQQLADATQPLRDL